MTVGTGQAAGSHPAHGQQHEGYSWPGDAWSNSAVTAARLDSFWVVLFRTSWTTSRFFLGGAKLYLGGDPPERRGEAWGSGRRSGSKAAKGPTPTRMWRAPRGAGTHISPRLCRHLGFEKIVETQTIARPNRDAQFTQIRTHTEHRKSASPHPVDRRGADFRTLFCRTSHDSLGMIQNMWSRVGTGPKRVMVLN